MKKVVITLLVLILLCVSLIPRTYLLSDGGSVIYRSLVYQVQKHHEIVSVNEYRVGYTVKIFGVKVFDNTQTERDDIK